MDISPQNFTATQVFYSLMLTAPPGIVWIKDDKSPAVTLNKAAVDFIIKESQAIARSILANENIVQLQPTANEKQNDNISAGTNPNDTTTT